jgi:hypothetical protein
VSTVPAKDMSSAVISTPVQTGKINPYENNECSASCSISVKSQELEQFFFWVLVEYQNY